MADFSGKTVVVTGGSRGIGRGIVDRFVAAGAEVVVVGRTPAEIPGARFVQADVRDLEQLDRAIGDKIDVLINNAGGSPAADAATVSPRFVEKVIQLNLLAPFWLAQKANAVMQKQPHGGAIINIASVSGMRPSPGTAAYGAAKAGLINLTQTLGVEWAPKVRVNCVVGGPIRTEQAEAHYAGERGIAAVDRTIPMGRMGNADDVAGACLYLASDDARWVTGAAITVHGGGEWPAFLTAIKNVT